MKPQLRDVITRVEACIARADYRLRPEVKLLRDDVVALLAEVMPVTGSSVCPHCRVDFPHQHFIDRKGNAHPLPVRCHSISES